MSGALIRSVAADFGYGKRRILTGVDLEIGAGEFLGILGPNGAGKTTLFRGLLGLIRPLAGSLDRGTTRVGYVPQQEQLDPAWPLSVREIIEMGLAKRPAREDRAQAQANLERVGLGDRARATFSELSGGQRQRVLIARALMGSPEVLFLDEPTSGVDRPNQKLIVELLCSLNDAGRGPAVLVVAHELELLADVASAALWVDGGQVERLSHGEFAQGRGIEALFAARHGKVSL